MFSCRYDFNGVPGGVTSPCWTVGLPPARYLHDGDGQSCIAGRPNSAFLACRSLSSLSSQHIMHYLSLFFGFVMILTMLLAFCMPSLSSCHEKIVYFTVSILLRTHTQRSRLQSRFHRFRVRYVLQKTSSVMVWIQHIPFYSCAFNQLTFLNPIVICYSTGILFHWCSSFQLQSLLQFRLVLLKLTFSPPLNGLNLGHQILRSYPILWFF